MKYCDTHSQIIDSRFHGYYYSTDRSKEIFSDISRISRWLTIESKIAMSQAKHNIIPTWAANEITLKSEISLYDVQEIIENLNEDEHSLVGLLKALQGKCDNDAGQFVHYGITTQDVQDTEQILTMKEVLNTIRIEIIDVLEFFKTQIEKYSCFPIIARTHSQPASITTLGLKIADWYDSLFRIMNKIESSRSTILVAQLFGGDGTQSYFKDKGTELLNTFAHELNIGVPNINWFVSRDRIAEYIFNLALLINILSRISNEIRDLVRPEINEMSFIWNKNTLASSTMPHKRNPTDCEQISVLAQLINSHCNTSLNCMVLDHERDFRGTRTEWVTITDSSHYSLKAIQLFKSILHSYVFNDDGIKYNINKYRNTVLSEKVVFALAEYIGKQHAFNLIHELVQYSIDSNMSFIDLLKTNITISKYYSNYEIDNLFILKNNIGNSEKIIATVLNQNPIVISHI